MQKGLPNAVSGKGLKKLKYYKKIVSEKNIFLSPNIILLEKMD